ncbi:DMT family transporter [Thermaerobacillus caldiproteolyticus]|uniref:Transporter family-2 protein n=1 Tax=Thermaerobacillus caldiproteolyticus TaxID=247480 RepID=A0A7V9Z8L7_9BACL|nr:DMT family transporter [Anoxybacillus caldiproteolyticus]MBA2876072.1 transporter family-2 protein [Anoxybacillus caldiproteolyticus]QPA32298.1 DMT family transporter [Anoxybacillus caldiproteolyticus]
MKFLYILLALLGGMMAGIQAPINGSLGKRIGSVEGAFTSFFVGTLFLTLLVLFFGKGQITHLFQVPKWNLLGGLLGALFVTFVVISVPNVGVALTIFAAIIGQIVISIIIDHFGLFGVQKIPMNANRLLGLALMLAALFFIYRGSVSS